MYRQAGERSTWGNVERIAAWIGTRKNIASLSRRPIRDFGGQLIALGLSMPGASCTG
jgi:hypothetical protein